MKVCYVDESGNQDTDPCLVMVGLLIDTSRRNRSKIEVGDLFDRAEALFREKLQELKASRIVFGRGGWRSIDPEERKRLAHDLCLWVMDRKHDILLTAMDRGKLRKKQHSSLPAFCTDIWLSCAVHIALQVQKANKNKPRNKGQTFLVFDENKVKADRLAEIRLEKCARIDRHQLIAIEIIRLYLQQLNLWTLGKITTLKDADLLQYDRRRDRIELLRRELEAMVRTGKRATA